MRCPHFMEQLRQRQSNKWKKIDKTSNRTLSPLMYDDSATESGGLHQCLSNIKRGIYRHFVIEDAVR